MCESPHRRRAVYRNDRRWTERCAHLRPARRSGRARQVALLTNSDQSALDVGAGLKAIGRAFDLQVRLRHLSIVPMIPPRRHSWPTSLDHVGLGEAEGCAATRNLARRPDLTGIETVARIARIRPCGCRPCPAWKPLDGHMRGSESQRSESTGSGPVLSTGPRLRLDRGRGAYLRRPPRTGHRRGCCLAPTGLAGHDRAGAGVG